MSMYWLELVNTILSNEEDKPVAIKSPARRPDSGYKKDFQTTKKSFEKPDYSKTDKPAKKDSAYCLFATSGQSFEAMYKNQKITILLAGIDLPDKNNYISKKANHFINEQIKKKAIFLDKIEIVDNNTIMAEVYLDAQKTLSLNQLMIEQNLHKVQKRSYPVYEKATPASQPADNVDSSLIENRNTIPEKIQDKSLLAHKEEQDMNHVNHLLSEAHGDSAPLDYGWSEDSAPIEYGDEYIPPYEWENVEESSTEAKLSDNHEPQSEPFHDLNEEPSAQIEITPTMDDILSVLGEPLQTISSSENLIAHPDIELGEKKDNAEAEPPVVKKTKGFGLTR